MRNEKTPLTDTAQDLLIFISISFASTVNLRYVFRFSSYYLINIPKNMDFPLRERLSHKTCVIFLKTVYAFNPEVIILLLLVFFSNPFHTDTSVT